MQRSVLDGLLAAAEGTDDEIHDDDDEVLEIEDWEIEEVLPDSSAATGARARP